MLKFHPKAGAILLCDFKGFTPPEMTKERPVVVITPRLRRRDGLCTVVPLSTTEPEHVEDYHYKIKFDRPLPSPWNAPQCWVKADMFCTVSFARLHLIGIGRDHEGKRKYLNMILPYEELTRIQACVLHALNLGPLTKYL